MTKSTVVPPTQMGKTGEGAGRGEIDKFVSGHTEFEVLREMHFGEVTRKLKIQSAA